MLLSDKVIFKKIYTCISKSVKCLKKAQNMLLNWISKPVISPTCTEEEAMSLLIFYYCICSSSWLPFQNFLLFVAISVFLYHDSGGIYNNLWQGWKSGVTWYLRDVFFWKKNRWLSTLTIAILMKCFDIFYCCRLPFECDSWSQQGQ